MGVGTTAWLNGLAQKLAIAGVLKAPNSVGWNFVSGATAVYNSTTGFWDITVAGGGGGGSGDVVGPGTVTDGRIVLFDTTTGKLIKQSSFLITDIIKANGGTPFTSNQSLGNNKLTGIKRLSYGAAEYNNGDSGTTKTIDLGNGDAQKLQLTGNVTLTITTDLVGWSQVRYYQDVVGGRTITHPAIVWVGAQPTIGPNPGDELLVGYFYNGATLYGFGSTGGSGDIKSDGSVAFTANQSMGTHKLTSLAAPTVGTDATNKTYVDAGDAAVTALIPAAGGAPVNVTKAAAAAGSATTFSKSDHKHDITTAVVGAIDLAGVSAAEGSATSLARSDHAHSLTGTLGSGSIPSVLAASGTTNCAIDLRPSTNAKGTVNTGGSISNDVALASGKRYIITADYHVDDGSGGWLYSKALSVRCHNNAGTCQITFPTVIGEAFNTGVSGFTVTATISTTNLRFTLANTNGTNRPYNVIIGVVVLDKP